VNTAPCLHFRTPIGDVSLSIASGPGVVVARATCGIWPAAESRLTAKEARAVAHLFEQAAQLAENAQ
jgi:hypothetical protein